jgi:hypothetical protein
MRFGYYVNKEKTTIIVFSVLGGKHELIADLSNTARVCVTLKLAIAIARWPSTRSSMMSFCMAHEKFKFLLTFAYVQCPCMHGAL